MEIKTNVNETGNNISYLRAFELKEEKIWKSKQM